MLHKETVEYIKDNIKEINRLKDVDARCTRMIELKDEIHMKINDQMDELFSNINLKKIKINLEE